MKYTVVTLVIAFVSFITVPNADTLKSDISKGLDTAVTELQAESGFLDSVAFEVIDLGRTLEIEEANYKLFTVCDIKLHYWSSETVVEVTALGIWGHWFEF